MTGQAGTSHCCKSATRMMRCALVIAWASAGWHVALAARQAAALQAKPASTASTIEHTGAPTDNLQRIATIETDIRDAHYVTVEPVLRDYLREYPSSWRAHYDLGYVLFRIRGGKMSLADAIRESIGELSRSLELNTKNPDAHKILALDLVMIQRDDLAETEFKEAERLDPASAEIHYFLGRHYMGQSNYIPAKKELETAIHLDPTYMKAYENLGITMDMMGDGSAALAYYLKAIDLNERQPAPSELPYLDLSRFYHNQNKITLAEMFALKALHINPRSDQAYFELARNYRERAEWSKAAEALTKAIAIDPYVAQDYFLLGRTYAMLGKQQESRKAFSNYLKYRDLTSQHSGTPGSQQRRDNSK